MMFGSGKPAGSAGGGSLFAGASAGKLLLIAATLAATAVIGVVALRPREGSQAEHEAPSPVNAALQRNEAPPADTAAVQKSEQAAPTQTTIPPETNSQLVPLSLVHGLVVDVSGRPVEGAQVVLEREAPRAPWWTDLGPYRVSQTTDDTGTFRFEGVPLQFCTNRYDFANVLILIAELDGLCATKFVGGNHTDRECFAELVLFPRASLSGTVVDSRGAPVEGAMVSLRNWDASGPNFGTWALDCIRRSDKNGRFRFAYLFPAVYELETSARGCVGEQPLRFQTGGEDVTLVMKPKSSGRIVCRMFDDTTGLAIPDQKVEAWSTEGGGFAEKAETNAEGVAVFDRLEPGDYRVELPEGPYVFRETPAAVSLRQSFSWEEVTFGLVRGATLSGRVLHAESGRPLPGLSISARTGGGQRTSRHALTDADGSFHIEGLSRGSYAVEAVLRILPPVAATNLHIASLQDAAYIDLFAEGVTSVAGRVVNEAGEPLAHASVFTEGLHTKPLDTFTNSKGEFSAAYRLDYRRITLQALHTAGVSSRLGPLSPREHRMDDLVLSVVPSGTIAGRVVDRDGNPLLRATVMVKPANESSKNIYLCGDDDTYRSGCLALSDGSDTTFDHGARTGPTGRFRFTSLVPDTYFVNVYISKGWPGTPDASTTVSVRPGEMVDDVTLVCPVGVKSRVEGTVTMDGAVLAGQGVEWQFAGEQLSNRHTWTNTEGRYRIDDPPAGPIKVWCSRAESDEGREVIHMAGARADLSGKGTTTLDIVSVSGKAVVEGCVDIEERDAFNAWVRAEPSSDDDVRESRAKLGADGKYRLSGLPAGGYRIQVVKIGGDVQPFGYYPEGEVVLGDGEVVRLDFEAECAVLTGALSGMGEGERGLVAVVPGEVIVDEITEAELYQHQVARNEIVEDGRFNFGGLDPGLYTVFYGVLPRDAGDTGQPAEKGRLLYTLAELEARETTELQLVAP